MEVVSIPLTHVFTRKGARRIVDSTVNGLIDSIREVGLINPLRVRPARLFVMGIEDDAYEVIAGGHRLAALRKLGREFVECVIVNDDALHIELAEIDENLMRAELSDADRAHQTARRKAIYLDLYPKTGHGGDRKSDQVDNLSTRSFAEATAAATGKDERTVRRDAERGKKISEEALMLVRGTVLDKGTELDKLKKIAPEKQIDWVKKRLAEAKTSKASRKPKQPKQSKQRGSRAAPTAVDAFEDLWEAASDEDRREIYETVRAYAEQNGWQ